MNDLICMRNEVVAAVPGHMYRLLGGHLASWTFCVEADFERLAIGVEVRAHVEPTAVCARVLITMWALRVGRGELRGAVAGLVSELMPHVHVFADSLEDRGRILQAHAWRMADAAYRSAHASPVSGRAGELISAVIARHADRMVK